MRTLTKSTEDYLEAIYLISQKNNIVRVKHIAAFLDVSLPSVTEAIKKLNTLNLVENEKYGHIRLTPKGQNTAKKIYAKHRMLFEFLTTTFKVSEKTALHDACCMEHCISKETTTKLRHFVQKQTNKKL